MTFSLVARCPETGMFATAVASSSPAVAARCSFARAGVGAVASQNVTDPTLGTLALDLMKNGLSAPDAVRELVARGSFIEYRQILAVDAAGRTGIYSGPNALGIWAEAMAKDAASGGNLLAHDSIPQVIIDAFLSASGHIGDRMIAAMRAGLASGGETGPIHSAGLKIVDTVSWPIADLRCDWTEDCPIESIATAWDVYKPQIDDYIQRAIDPSKAPSYGVPGDK